MTRSPKQSPFADYWTGVKVGWAVLLLAGIVFWRCVRNRKEKKLDQAGRAAKGEAAKAREAGKRGDGEEVLKSFHEATRK
jgi:membrane protein implicated in regulation of membrane protease activity